MISDEEAYKMFCTLDYVLNRANSYRAKIRTLSAIHAREIFVNLLSINTNHNIPISFIDSTGEELTTATVTQLTWDGMQLSLAVM